MRRTQILVFLLSLSLVLGFFSQYAAADTELVFILVQENDKELWTPSAQRFERDHPGVKVKFILQSSGYSEKVLTMIATGIAPDVIIRSSDGSMLEWMLDGYILDLAPYIDRSASHFKNWIPEYRLRTYYEGRSFGVTVPKAGVYPFWLNLRLFDQAGLDYPKGEWSFDDFRNSGRKLTADLDGDGVPDQYAFHQSWKTWMSFLYNNSGGIQDPNDPGQLWLDLPNTIEALEFMQNLEYVDGIANPDHRFNSGRTMQAFTSGRTAMTQRSLTWYGSLPEDMKDGGSLGIALPPNGKGQTYTMSTVGALAIPTASKHHDLAFELIKYLTDEETQRHIKMETRGAVVNNKINLEFFPSRLPVWNHDNVFLQSVQLPMFSTDVMMPDKASGLVTEMINATVRDNKMPAKIGVDKYVPLIREAMKDFLDKL